jgi:hypothetical protein
VERNCHHGNNKDRVQKGVMDQKYHFFLIRFFFGNALLFV